MAYHFITISIFVNFYRIVFKKDSRFVKFSTFSIFIFHKSFLVNAPLIIYKRCSLNLGICSQKRGFLSPFNWFDLIHTFHFER